MLSPEVLSDTEFAEQAALAVDSYVTEHGCPKTVTRAQIYGLLHVAKNQPTSVKQFAGHQKQRAEKRNDEDQRLFWVCVEQLCDGSPPRTPWSLQQCAERSMPPELHGEDVAPGEKLSLEQRQRRSEVKKARQRWLFAWYNEHYPQFFQRFCAHYLYRLGMKGD